MSEDSKAYEATVMKRRRWSSIWVIPLVALALASWLVWKNYADKGPVVLITFETADSLKAGNTEVRCRSVKVGVVETVSLGKDLRSVDVKLRINPESTDLLRRDTRFWVVRPRVSARDVSGLGTLLTGAYIELEPGESKSESLIFTGLEQPPITSSTVPGLRLTLVAKKSGSLDVGSPMYYQGFEVGQVERRELDIKARRLKFDVFIENEYASLISTNTRFWNTSGINVSAGADGFKVSTPSFQSLVAGGASFSRLDGAPTGDPVTNGTVFTLYDDEASARESSFEVDQKALLFFDQSVRGLKRGAPVEFRGITLGRVSEISMRHSPEGDPRIPVVIEFDASNLQRSNQEERDPQARILDAISRGLQAKLGTASLLTGALFVDLDFDADHTQTVEISMVGDLPVIPTKSSGLAQMEGKLNAILTKLEALPLDETLTKFGNTADEATTTIADARTTFDEINATLSDLRTILGAESTKALPADLNATLADLRTAIDSLGPGGNVQGDLRRTLDEMRSALRSFQTLSSSIEEKPNSLIFGREASGDPIPRARPVR